MGNGRSLKIALIGTRGVPANYGGFETCVEEVGKRLALKGHEVTVYCRKSYYKEQKHIYKGMVRVSLPNMQYKSFDTISHTILSVFHSTFKNYDIYMVFNSANSFFLGPLRLLGKNLVINPDGLEWMRSKWGKFAKMYYKYSEVLSCVIANRLITDSKGIQNYYQKEYNTGSSNIAYGAYLQKSENNDNLRELGLEPQKYFLQITRFEPENYPLLTITAFKKLRSDKKLVIVGGNPYPNDYTREIEDESDSDSQIILPGFIYEKELLRELWCNCKAYIHGNSVGGTNPALLQAMASGCCIIASNVSFNVEVLNRCGIYYDLDENSLTEKMQWILENKDHCEILAKKAQNRVKQFYSWDKITEKYERVFIDLVEGKYKWRIKSLTNLNGIH